MGLLKGLIGAAVLVACFTGAAGAQTRPFILTQTGSKTVPLPTPAFDRGPSNVELVNRALNPGAPAPGVPLPHPDLSTPGGSQPEASDGPQVFARQEDGGGVLGFRVPIPAERAGPQVPTTYGVDASSSERPSERR